MRILRSHPVNKNSTPRKVSKTNQPVANPVETIERALVMVAAVAAVTEAVAAVAAVAEIVETDKCFQRYVPPAERKPKFRLNLIRRNQSTVETVSKNQGTVEHKIM